MFDAPDPAFLLMAFDENFFTNSPGGDIDFSFSTLSSNVNLSLLSFFGLPYGSETFLGGTVLGTVPQATSPSSWWRFFNETGFGTSNSLLPGTGRYSAGFGVVDDIHCLRFIPGRSGTIIRCLRLEPTPPSLALNLPVFWDVTNRTEELFTASDDGEVEAEAGEEEIAAGQPMAEVLNMLNTYFDAVIRARENLNYYAWR
jgi:hypothetical protein